MPPCNIVNGGYFLLLGINRYCAKEKETANAISLSEGCAYTPVMVEVTGLAV